MEYLKDVFADKALTYNEFVDALKGNEKIKLCNLADGGYVDAAKYSAKEGELASANGTIATLQDQISKLDGVDVDKLKADLKALQEKYDTELSAVRKDSAVNIALSQANARNIKAVKALLDLDSITVDGDAVSGLSEQIESIKNDNAYLFFDAQAKPGIEIPTGQKPAPRSDEAYLDAYYKNNPFYKR